MSTKQRLMEYIYITADTQVDSGHHDLKRGCAVFAGRIYKLDEKYTSVEKLPNKQPVEFKINENKAATLIKANKAVCVARKSGKSNGEWIAVNIFGDPIPDGPAIILKKDEKGSEPDKKPGDPPK